MNCQWSWHGGSRLTRDHKRILNQQQIKTRNGSKKLKLTQTIGRPSKTINLVWSNYQFELCRSSWWLTMNWRRGLSKARIYSAVVRRGELQEPKRRREVARRDWSTRFEWRERWTSAGIWFLFSFLYKSVNATTVCFFIELKLMQPIPILLYILLFYCKGLNWSMIF